MEQSPVTSPTPTLSRLTTNVDMAPEVLRALDGEKRKGNYGTPADIWSLGSVLFYLCSHENAFSGRMPSLLLPSESILILNSFSESEGNVSTIAQY